MPTWNYLTVHAYGPVEFFEDADRLLEVVTRLTDLHERSGAEPWAVTERRRSSSKLSCAGSSVADADQPLEGKRKLSQNRNERIGRAWPPGSGRATGPPIAPWQS